MPTSAWVALGVGALIAVAGLAVVLSYVHKVIPQGIKVWVADLQTTNFRIIVSVWMSVIVVGIIMVGMMLHALWPTNIGEFQEGIVNSVLIFLASMMGIDAIQFIGKRATMKPELMALENANTRVPPPDVEVETDKATVTVRQPDSASPDFIASPLPPKMKKPRPKLERDD